MTIKNIVLGIACLVGFGLAPFVVIWWFASIDNFVNTVSPQDHASYDRARLDERAAANKKATDLCLQKGGIPLVSAWSGDTYDCKEI